MSQSPLAPHVLLVEDEPAQREMLAYNLQAEGFRVTQASDGDEGLSCLRDDPPDVLVSDVGMPDEDGYELIRRIRSLPADRGGKVPAVALTAYARTEDRLQALRAGYQMHVPKPVELAELVAVAASLINRK